MDNFRFGIGSNVIPLLNPQDIAANATASPWVNLKSSVHATFLLYFGNIAAASADQAVTVTVEAATAAASGSEAAVAFKYRLSSAVGANAWGAITDATAAGASIATTDDGKMLLIDIDPRALEGALADASHVRFVVTPDAGGSATLVAGLGVLEPREAKTSISSAT